jgi:DNA-directed RNA polymerase specialized sigma24 family protein
MEPATNESPLADLISQEQRKAYERALSQLSAEDREAIVGRLEMRTSYRDLAIAWGKPSADAARKTVERAVLRLAVQMQVDGPRRIS